MNAVAVPDGTTLFSVGRRFPVPRRKLPLAML